MFANTPCSLALLGIALGLVLYVGAVLVGAWLGNAPVTRSPSLAAAGATCLLVMDLVANGFGEESAFRACVQSRLIRRHGVATGVGLSSLVFVLLHLLITQYSAPVLLASVLLSAMYGLLTVWTRSVYLTGAMHVVYNLAPRLLQHWPADIGLLTAHGVAASQTTFVVVVALFALRGGFPRLGRFRDVDG